MNFQEIPIKKGQFIFGRRLASKKTGLSESSVRTCLKFLEKSEKITIKTTNKFSVISIINWDTYQKRDVASDQQDNQQLASKSPATSQQLASKSPTSDHRQELKKERKKELKNGKNGKKEPPFTPPPKKPPCPHQDIISLYNKTLPSLPAVRPKLWNSTRKADLAARWKEDPERQSVDWWRAYFKIVQNRPFLLGENNRGWAADLGWLVKKKNMIKVLEGNYKTHNLAPEEVANGTISQAGYDSLQDGGDW